jgi:hypothetical protein
MYDIDEKIRRVLSRAEFQSPIETSGPIEHNALIEDLHRDNMRYLQKELDVSFESAKFTYIDHVNRVQREDKIKARLSLAKGYAIAAVCIAILLYISGY